MSITEHRRPANPRRAAHRAGVVRGVHSGPQAWTALLNVLWEAGDVLPDEHRGVGGRTRGTLAAGG